MLLCVWYRPPFRGEIESITSFMAEYEGLRNQVISTIICGDFNIHQKRWLVHSRENTPEGSMLQAFVTKNGFTEIIKNPTRGKYLLDLFITDYSGSFTTDILPCISDHKCTQMKINICLI